MSENFTQRLEINDIFDDVPYNCRTNIRFSDQYKEIYLREICKQSC